MGKEQANKVSIEVFNLQTSNHSQTYGQNDHVLVGVKIFLCYMPDDI